MAIMLETVFANDGYQTRDLSLAINKVPYAGRKLAPLFTYKGLTQRNLLIERKHGVVQVIPTKAWNSGETTMLASSSRDAVPFSCVHVPHDAKLLASEVSGIRAFGEASELETFEGVLNEKLVALRENHEATWEKHRVGAITGTVLDADGSTLFDLFDAFGISQTSVDFVLGTTTTEIKDKCEAVRAAIEDALGGTPFTGIVAQVSPLFFANLVKHAMVKAAYDYDSVSQFFRTNQIAEGTFSFCGIRFERYRGGVDDNVKVTSGVGYAYPEGVQGLFVQYGAPMEAEETVNTVALPIYVMQERMEFGVGRKVHSESNPAFICSRPEILIRLHSSN